jgi:hypothetical protein
MRDMCSGGRFGGDVSWNLKVWHEMMMDALPVAGNYRALSGIQTSMNYAVPENNATTSCDIAAPISTLCAYVLVVFMFVSTGLWWSRLNIEQRHPR